MSRKETTHAKGDHGGAGDSRSSGLRATTLAQGPVALVEEVRGHPADVEFMDYVRASKVIRLGPREWIVLSYLASCWRETITGGTVTVGTEQSDVQGGKVARAKVPCDGDRILLTPGQANQSAGTIFRSTTVEAPLTLYGVSPVVDATAGDALLIVRTDSAASIT